MDLEKEESIDLGKLWQVTKAHKKVVGGIIVGWAARLQLCWPLRRAAALLAQPTTTWSL